MDKPKIAEAPIILKYFSVEDSFGFLLDFADDSFKRYESFLQKNIPKLKSRIKIDPEEREQIWDTEEDFLKEKIEHKEKIAANKLMISLYQTLLSLADEIAHNSGYLQIEQTYYSSDAMVSYKPGDDDTISQKTLIVNKLIYNNPILIAFEDVIRKSYPEKKEFHTSDKFFGGVSEAIKSYENCKSPVTRTDVATSFLAVRISEIILAHLLILNNIMRFNKGGNYYYAFYSNERKLE